MKFVCLLHESELSVIELTEYKDTDTSIRHITYINYSDTYLHPVLYLSAWADQRKKQDYMVVKAQL